MENRKCTENRNLLITSIKPSRPEYPADQTLVNVQESLKAWDNLYAYYQGEVIKLNAELLKLQNQLSSMKSGSKRKRSTSSRRKTSRKSSSEEQTTLKPTFLELFGESPPSSECDGSDVETTRPKSKRQHKGHESSNISNAKSFCKKKSSKRKIGDEVEKLHVKIKKEEEIENESVKQEEDQAKLNPLHNLKVESDRKLKKRVSLDQLKKGKIGGCNTLPKEEYKPPKTLGLNAVQNKNVLDHKDEATPPTITVITPPMNKLNSTFLSTGKPSNTLKPPHGTPKNTYSLPHRKPSTTSKTSLGTFQNAYSHPHPHVTPSTTSSTPHGAPSTTSSTPHGAPSTTSRTPRGTPSTTSRIPNGTPSTTSRTPRGTPSNTSRTPHGTPSTTSRTPHGTPQNTYSLPHGTPQTKFKASPRST